MDVLPLATLPIIHRGAGDRKPNSRPIETTLELVEIAYYLKEEREAAIAEYLATRPSLAEIEARLA